MHRFVHAVAGSGKTELIATELATLGAGSRALAITFTSTGQAELRGRIEAKRPKGSVNVLGWYGFLLAHVIRPYLPLVFPGHEARGFVFEDSEYQESLRYWSSTDWPRYLSADGLTFRSSIEQLANLIVKEAGTQVAGRLALCFEMIAIDEAQDISGYGLDVLEFLLRQTAPRLLIAGDCRQATLSTAHGTNRHQVFNGTGRLRFYEKMEKEGLLSIEAMTETHRCCYGVARFASQIFHPEEGFPALRPSSTLPAGVQHSGMFLVPSTRYEEYRSLCSPQLLRLSKTSGRWIGDLSYRTVKGAKGLTFDHVALACPATVEKYILQGEPLSPGTAMDLYIAATRARHSVALVVPSQHLTINPSLRGVVNPWPDSSVLTPVQGSLEELLAE